jgi:mono/diheme cytochrome c family protein
MKPILAALLGVGATLMALALGAGLFVESGLYNMGADDHHTKPVFALIEQLRVRSIVAHARGLPVPTDLDTPARVQLGAHRYASLCARCHLAPGVTHSEIRAGLYPHPPNLAQANVEDPQKAFWTIKHGLKMSAMPAWGTILSDEDIWNVVAFVRHMPELSADAYQEGLGVHSMSIVPFSNCDH